MGLRSLDDVDDTECVVVVPTAADGLIDPASGVVAYRRDGSLMVDFEGNRFAASNLTRWADRVLHAYERAAACYPTVARAGVTDPAAYVVVGEFDPAGRCVRLDPAARATVEQWLGHPVTDADLTCV